MEKQGAMMSVVGGVMTSFVRTIQQEEEPGYIEAILSRSDHFIPLKFCPKRAGPGDFIYLAYRGRIVGRALIGEIDLRGGEVPIGHNQRSYRAKCLVWYRGGWQRSPRYIPFKGCQGIRYLDVVGLEDLDSEQW